MVLFPFFENMRMVLHKAYLQPQYESNIIIGMFDTGNCINRSNRTFYVGSTMNFGQ
jgi:hypothetical protein